MADALAERARSHVEGLPPAEADEVRQRVRDRARDLLDEWWKIAMELNQVGAGLQYQVELGKDPRLLYEFLNPELKMLPSRRYGSSGPTARCATWSRA